ncbi:L-2-hydroxyglutarate oxidase [Pseudalkalibacillus salsuginis]|uniref:L-2-hydroxyglutarate oxidase n=1 Tax=Pseudalkalibacillus salsuginis TaxID=2910972 RepID=UPI001F1A3893|nr:L-2-hydroxyglutarate oxidase [Pseudalkalibacillus salsuginis]MCF6409942.1 L-2-hydroxyglutarate oxidase [Pseudalkalibacillus salsuginis]
MYDVMIIGGGIVGLSTAYALTEHHPSLKIAVLEKENSWAKHQTGHNSGVIHSGIYYKPGSLKARFAKDGGRKLAAFCGQYGISYEQCGKVIVATDEKELDAMQNLYERGLKNGLDITLLDQAGLKEEEPYVNGIKAIKVPQAGIIDYVGVCSAIVSVLENRGADLFLSTEANDIKESPNEVTVETASYTYRTKHLVNCCGLQSDRVAKRSGQDPDLKIVPFRGEYFELKPEKEYLVKNLIYPVPNPDFPFLGVHFTRMIGGGVEAGPNAVLGFKREGYRKRDISLKDLSETLTYPGFWKLASSYWREGLDEMIRSFNKGAFVRSLQRLIPSIEADDLKPAPAGIRAQALKSDGSLVDDFFLVHSKRSTHVCNAPSPAATACFPIGEHIAKELDIEQPIKISTS